MFACIAGWHGTQTLRSDRSIAGVADIVVCLGLVSGGEVAGNHILFRVNSYRAENRHAGAYSFSRNRLFAFSDVLSQPLAALSTTKITPMLLVGAVCIVGARVVIAHFVWKYW